MSSAIKQIDPKIKVRAEFKDGGWRELNQKRNVRKESGLSNWQRVTKESWRGEEGESRAERGAVAGQPNCACRVMLVARLSRQ